MSSNLKSVSVYHCPPRPATRIQKISRYISSFFQEPAKETPPQIITEPAQTQITSHEFNLNRFALDKLFRLAEAIKEGDLLNADNLLKDSSMPINRHFYKVQVPYGQRGMVDEIYFPLLIAIFSSFEEGLKSCCRLRKDLNINEKTRELGLSAISLTLTERRFSMTDLLLDLKESKSFEPDLDINIQTKAGFSPLHFAALFGTEENFDIISIIKRLLSYPEIKVNLQTKDESTALHLAVVKENPSVVKLLLESGKADIFLMHKNHGSALMIAKKQSTREIQQIFISYFEKNFVLDFSDPALTHLKTNLNGKVIPFPQLENTEGNNSPLKKFQDNFPALQYLHFKWHAPYENPENDLKYENPESDLKVVLAHLKEDTIYFNFYAADLFKKHIYTAHICPITQKPLSNILDFSQDKFTNNCYILNHEIFGLVENLALINAFHINN